MNIVFAAVALVISLQDATCKPGQVLAVEHGRDYTLNICGVGIVGLRGVEPPLRSAAGFQLEPGRIVGGEVLGGTQR